MLLGWMQMDLCQQNIRNFSEDFFINTDNVVIGSRFVKGGIKGVKNLNSSLLEAVKNVKILMIQFWDDIFNVLQ